MSQNNMVSNESFSSEDDIIASSYNLHAQKNWNIKGQDGQQEVNMEKQDSFETLLNDYMNHEQTNKTNEKASNFSAILHGHQDLTETFLGPSDKVRKLKKRVKKAYIQQKTSIELQRKYQMNKGRTTSNENIDSRESSNDDIMNKDGRDKILVTQNPSAWLANQPQRFKPTNSQMWESGMIYSEEQKQKAYDRMVMLSQMKKTSFKSPFNQMHAQKQAPSYVSQSSCSNQNKTLLPLQQQQHGKPSMNMTTKASKAFYLYEQQLQKKRDRHQQSIEGTMERQAELQSPFDSISHLRKINHQTTILLQNEKCIGNSPPPADLNEDDLRSLRSDNSPCMRPLGNVTMESHATNDLATIVRETRENTKSDETSDIGDTTGRSNKMHLNSKIIGVLFTERQQQQQQQLLSEDTTSGEQVMQLFEDSKKVKQAVDQFSYRVRLAPVKKFESVINPSSDLDSTKTKIIKTERAIAEDQVSKESPYFVVYNSKSKEKIQVGGPLTKQLCYSQTPNESQAHHTKTSRASSKKSDAMNTKRALFQAASSSRTSSVGRKQQLMEDIVAMQNYGDLAMADIVSRQSPEPVPVEVYANQKIVMNSFHNRSSTLNKEDSESGEYQVYLNQRWSNSGDSFIVKGTALATKTSGFNKKSSLISTGNANEMLAEEVHSQPQPQQKQQDTNDSQIEKDKSHQQPPASMSDEENQVETLAHASINEHSSVRQSNERYLESSKHFEREKNNASEAEDQSQKQKQKQQQQQMVELENHHMMMMSCQENDEAPDEGRMFMHGTSSKFNPQQPLLSNVEKNCSNRPMTTGVEQAVDKLNELVFQGGSRAKEDHINIVGQSAEIDCLADNTKSDKEQEASAKPPIRSAKSSLEEKQQVKQLADMKLNADSSYEEEEVEVDGQAVEKIDDKTTKSKELQEQQQQQILSNGQAGPSMSSSQEQLADAEQIQELPLKPTEQYASADKLATIDYNNAQQQKSRASIIEIQVDKADSNLINKFQSDSKLSRDQNLRLSPQHQRDNSDHHQGATKQLHLQQNSSGKKDDNIMMEYSNLYASIKSPLKKSLGEHSVHTEFLSKMSKNGAGNAQQSAILREMVNAKSYNQFQQQQPQQNNDNMITLEGTDGELLSKTDNKIMTNNHSEETFCADRNTYQTLIQNQPSMAISKEQPSQTGGTQSKNNQVKRVSAFKLPLARGKGDLLPALEKDLREPGKQFKNLTRLFKDKQKEKFYSKNSQLARSILKKIGVEQTSHHILPLNKTSKEYNNQVDSIIEFTNDAGDYFDTRFSHQNNVYRESNLSHDLLNSTQRERQQNMTETDNRRFPGHTNLSTFRSKAHHSLQPNHLEAVRENKNNSSTFISKQQKKLNDLINLKYDIQRKREMSSMVHLSKPFDSVNNDSSIDSADYNHHSMHSISIMGQNNLVVKAPGPGVHLHRTTFGQKLSQADAALVKANAFGSESIEIVHTGGSVGTATSRYLGSSNHSHHQYVSPPKTSNNNYLSNHMVHYHPHLNHLNQTSNRYASTQHHSKLTSLPLSIRQSGELHRHHKQHNNNNSNDIHSKMSIRIANINSKRSRLNNHSGLIGYHQMMQLNKEPAQQQPQQPQLAMTTTTMLPAAFNKTATIGKLSLDVAKANQLRAAGHMRNTAKGRPDDDLTDEYSIISQNNNSNANLSFNASAGAAQTMRRLTQRGEYESNVVNNNNAAAAATVAANTHQSQSAHPVEKKYEEQEVTVVQDEDYQAVTSAAGNHHHQAQQQLVIVEHNNSIRQNYGNFSSNNIRFQQMSQQKLKKKKKQLNLTATSMAVAVAADQKSSQLQLAPLDTEEEQQHQRSQSKRGENEDLCAEIMSGTEDGGSSIVIEMKKGSYLNSQRSNSMANMNMTQTVAGMRKGGKSTSLIRNEMAVVPINKMPILIVDSGYKASKQIKSYKQRKVMNLVSKTNKTMLPTFIV